MRSKEKRKVGTYGTGSVTELPNGRHRVRMRRAVDLAACVFSSADSDARGETG